MIARRQQVSFAHNASRALGASAESRSPMGTAIVGGLLTSTILTLVVVPVMYSSMDDLAGWVRRMIFGTAPTIIFHDKRH